MRTVKYILYSALGVAAVLLLTSDRANKIRNDVDDKTKELTGKLLKAGSNAKSKLVELARRQRQVAVN